MGPAQQLLVGRHQLPPAGQQQPDLDRQVVQADLPQVIAVAGRQRGGAGIVAIGLVRGATQRADPGRQGRGHVDDVLAGRYQPDCQQPPEATRALHRPAAVIESVGPRQQRRDLAPVCGHPQLVDGPVAMVDRYRGVRPLVRIDPDHHRHDHLLVRGR